MQQEEQKTSVWEASQCFQSTGITRALLTDEIKMFQGRKHLTSLSVESVWPRDLVSGFSFLSVILDVMSAGRKFLHSSDALNSKRP